MPKAVVIACLLQKYRLKLFKPDAHTLIYIAALSSQLHSYAFYLNDMGFFFQIVFRHQNHGDSMW